MASQKQLPHRIIQSAQVGSIHLRRLIAESRVRETSEIAEPDIQVGYSSRLAKRRPKAGFWVLVGAEVVVKDTARSAPESAVRIAADVEIRYDLPEELVATDEELTAFGDTNAVLNAWPYLRETIHTTSLRMGLPPLLLPLFRLSGPPGSATGTKVGKGNAKKGASTGKG